MNNSTVEYLKTTLNRAPTIEEFLGLEYFGDRSLEDLEGEHLADVLRLVQDAELTVTPQEWRYLSQFIDPEEFVSDGGDE